MAHSTITLTLDTYSHVLPSMQRDAAERIDEVFWALDTEPIHRKVIE
ncbi:MAG: hypothetical protein AAF654_12510 [Myxococcota bacterium]